MKYAARLERIAPFRVMELMERAKSLETAGHRVVHFEVGGARFLSLQLRSSPRGNVRWMPVKPSTRKHWGIPGLRARIAGYYAEHLGVNVPEQRVVITSGASGGLLLLSALLLNPDEELLMADPGYPCNEVFVSLVNGVAVRIPVTSDQDFQTCGP